MVNIYVDRPMDDWGMDREALVCIPYLADNRGGVKRFRVLWQIIQTKSRPRTSWGQDCRVHDHSQNSQNGRYSCQKAHPAVFDIQVNLLVVDQILPNFALKH